MNDLLTTDEVADLLQCEVTTVEDKLRRGELPGVKPGRSWMVPRVALMDTLIQQANANMAIRVTSPQPIAAQPVRQRGRPRSALPSLS